MEFLSSGFRFISLSQECKYNLSSSKLLNNADTNVVIVRQNNLILIVFQPIIKNSAIDSAQLGECACIHGAWTSQDCLRSLELSDYKNKK